MMESLGRCGRNLETLILNNFCSNITSEQSSNNIGKAIGMMIESNPMIQSISMQGASKGLISAFQTDGSLRIVMTVVGCLKNNSSIKEFDVSNNKLGDPLASSLADLLRSNQSLLHLNCDSNRITLSGWQSIAYALRSNNSLQMLDYPLQDVQRCLSQFANSLKKQKLLVDLMFEIDSLCRRNESNAGGRHPRLVSSPPSPPPSCAIDLDSLFVADPNAVPVAASSSSSSSSLASPYGAPPPVPSRSYDASSSSSSSLSSYDPSAASSYQDQSWDYSGGYDAE